MDTFYVSTDGGPSPRVQGAAGQAGGGGGWVGTIPAGAGSSGSRPGLARWRRDHPRRCGEQARVPAM